MDRIAYKQKISGNYLPLPTPFHDDFSLDLKSLRRLVRWLIERGYRTGNGVFLVGGAGGEFASMRTGERKKVMEAVVEETAGQVPVVVGVQDTNMDRILELARFADQIGADGLQVSAPYYDPATQDDILEMLKAISDASSVPMLVYNTWWTGSSEVTYECISEALEIANIGALKWHSPMMWSYENVIRDFAEQLPIEDNFPVEVYSHMLGATAFTSYAGLIWPEFGLRLWDCLQDGSYREAMQMVKSFRIPLNSLLFKACDYTCSEGHFSKAAFEIIGQPVGPVRPPARALPSDMYEQLRKILVQAEGSQIGDESLSGPCL